MKSQNLGWILFIVTGIILFFWIRTHTSPTGTGNNSVDSVFYWKMTNGNLVALLRKTENDFATEKKILLDSFSKAYNTKPAKIEEIIIAGAVTHDTLRGKDSIVYVKDQFASQVFTNPYYYIQTTLNFHHPDSSILTLINYDTLTLVWHNVRTGNIFSHKDSLQLDIYNSNPNSKIVGAHAYRKAEVRSTNFGLGFFLGYGYSFINSKPSPIIGVGLSWNPIKF